jgi:hypothetical protein
MGSGGSRWLYYDLFTGCTDARLNILLEVIPKSRHLPRRARGGPTNLRAAMLANFRASVLAKCGNMEGGGNYGWGLSEFFK